MKIAIVEDEPDIARLYTAILQDAGHQVWQVDQHNLEAIGDADTVIFDVMMPDVDGEQVAAILASHYPHVRKIAATAIYQVPARVSAIADVVLTKPFRAEDLLDAL